VQGVDFAVARFTARAALPALALRSRRLRRRGRRWEGRIRGRRLRQRDLTQCRVAARQQAFQHVTEIGEQVPAVGHLHRVGRTLTPALSVGPAAVAADKLDARVRREPVGQACRARIGEEVDRPSTLEIDQDRGVGAPFPQAPVIHAQDTRRGGIWQRGGADRPSQRIAADRDTDVAQQARAGRATDGDAEERGQWSPTAQYGGYAAW